MSEDKRVIGNHSFFVFLIHRKLERFYYRWAYLDFGRLLCEAGIGCNVAFTKWFYFLAVFVGVFEITYLIKKHPSGNLNTTALLITGS